ncbi:MAG: substrate-binding domain-containing protein [Ornithinimicrobium sp.]|uniref:substrate-binding domain-containing protein n=1 Tax=Ornithinimicrobium sp. TaxID=1977084 RepID=UPI0026E02B3E|nr:substrate-binding domain-containing protein [Ornithinimicrobium sp.]MDO5739905.1 substrate-binding domain-containing protein [Ornithinimicrobium sp.]
MARHSAGPQQTAWGKKLLAGFVALLVIIGGFSAFTLIRDGRAGDAAPPADSSGQDAGVTSGTDGNATGDEGPDAGTRTDDAAAAPDCTPLTVWAAPSLMPAAEAASEAATDDCFSYVVVSRESATAQSTLRAGEAPEVWLADSVAWPLLLSEDGVELEIGATIASSPVMLTGDPQVITALSGLGIGPDTTWEDLVAKYQQLASSPDGAPVSMRVGDPRVDPATMALLSTNSSQLSGWSEAGSEDRAMIVVLAQTAVQGDPLAALSGGKPTIVPATEQQIAAAGAEGVELAGLPLKDGAGVVQMPFVSFGDAGSAAAADALEKALTSDAAVQALAGSGLRAGTDGKAPGVKGVPDIVTAEAPEVDPQGIITAARIWTVIAPQSRILTLIDISGSMEAKVGDTTRIDLTREAAQGALSRIPQQTGVGVWYFATNLDGKKDFKEVVPLRALNTEVRSGVTQNQVLMAETDKLGTDILTGDTGLHDSLWAAYQHMQAQYTPQAISSVLLLTDGINDDPSGGLSEAQVIAKLTAAREQGDKPITVVLIGMGPEVDDKALARLAKAAGGESLVLRDPAQLPQVFVDVVASRAP